MCVCVYACVHVLGGKRGGAYCNPALNYTTGQKFGMIKIFLYFFNKMSQLIKNTLKTVKL